MIENIDIKINELKLSPKYEEKTEEEITFFENEYKLKLPQDYRYFIKKYGIVVFNEDICFLPSQNYPWSKNEYQSIVNFYGLDNGNLDLRKIINRYTNRLPDFLIPIAEFPGGNQICLKVGEDKYGSVFLWDHEKEQDIIEGKENVYFTSNSFYDFLMSFKICKNQLENVDSKIANIKISDKFLKRFQK